MSQPSRPTCSICGSRKFHKAITGQVVCQEGHVLTTFVQESHEREVDTGRLQRLRKTRKNRKAKVKLPSQNYVGDKAKFLQFECAQILLRQQIWTLINVWHLSDELEVVAKDLWGLYLTASDIPAAPQSKEGEHEIDVEPLGNSLAVDDDLEKAFPSDEDDESSSEDDQAIRSGDEESVSENEVLKKKKKKRVQKAKVLDPARAFHASHTLAICYLSCVTLKVPIFQNDLLRAARAGSLPFLRFANSLPDSFRSVLSPPVLESLNPKTVPDVVGHESLAFSATVNRFIKLYAEFDVSFPPLLAQTLMHRCLDTLLLAPWFGRTAMALLRRLDADFELSASPRTGDRLRGSYRKLKGVQNPDNTFMLSDTVVPAAVLVCLKLLYGLDNDARFLGEEEDHLKAVPTAQSWFDALDGLEKFETEHDRESNQSVADMTDAQIDAYLCVVKDKLSLNGSSINHSSATSSRIEACATLLSTLQEAATMSSARSQTDFLCGEGYPVYPTSELDVDSLPLMQRRTLDRLASLAGVNPLILLRCMAEIEKRMLSPKHWKGDMKDVDMTSMPRADSSPRLDSND